MPQLGFATGVVGGIYCSLVKLFLFLVVAVLLERNLGVMEIECRRLGADPGQLGEVVAWRRAGGRPLKRSPPAPRIVLSHLGVVPALPDVVEENQSRAAEQECPCRGDLVAESETVARQVVRVATRHALDAQPVLDQERCVEPDEQQPEMNLA